MGPTPTAILRLVSSLLAHSSTVTLDAHDLSQLLGVGGGSSKHGVLARSLRRLELFGAAEHVGPGAWRVRTGLPPLSQRQLERRGPLVRGFHHLLASHAMAS